jgi:hypothetical protein
LYFYFSQYILDNMAPSVFSRVTALLALVPSVVSWTLPLAPANNVPNYPEVPWKMRGLYSGSAAKDVVERDGYPTYCNHGPAARSCWKGDYNVDTDMDLEWPTTGILRKVR